MGKNQNSDEQMYTVQKIIDRRTTKNGKNQYLVKWVGWSINQSTWEPETNLVTVIDMVKQFNKKIITEQKLTLEAKSSQNPYKKSTPKDPPKLTQKKLEPPSQTPIQYSTLSNALKNSVKLQAPTPTQRNAKEVAQKQRPISKSIEKKNQITEIQTEWTQLHPNDFLGFQKTQNLDREERKEVESMLAETFVKPEEGNLVIEEMYDPNHIFSGSKFNIKNCEFVVIFNGRQMVMTREDVVRISPRALIQWYDRKLWMKKDQK